MFAIRGIAVSASVFVIVYGTVSLAISVTWRRFLLRSGRHSARHRANLLFHLRLFPLLAAAAITLVFVVPSFLLLEPRSIDEPMGLGPLILGACGLGLAVYGAVNAGIVLLRARRVVARWTRAAEPIPSSAPVPVLHTSDAVPSMTAAGIFRQKVLLSDAAHHLLKASEFQAALNHELAHLRRRDNLKKLLLHFVAFPGMRDLEKAWLEASEMAADAAAVSSSSEALDLAAALIKLSQLRIERPVDLTAALVQGSASLMNARVERLIAWNADSSPGPVKSPAWHRLGAAAAFALCALTYSPLLIGVHAATEWLVR
jgi:Zn-dependent protease with chaperone function